MLVQFQSEDRDFQLMQNSWAASLNPLLANPLSKSLILKGVSLSIGDNVINHKLGRKIQGWALVDVDGVAAIYRNAPKNELTLTLNSDAAVIVDILVF